MRVGAPGEERRLRREHRVLPVRAQPRDVLRAIPGVELVELPEAEICCGSAGIYNMLQPQAAADLGKRKANNIRGTGADVEFTTFSGDLDVQAAGARVTRSTRREREVVLGRGGARVEVRTFSGDVKLADR